MAGIKRACWPDRWVEERVCRSSSTIASLPEPPQLGDEAHITYCAPLVIGDLNAWLE